MDMFVARRCLLQVHIMQCWTKLSVLG